MPISCRRYYVPTLRVFQDPLRKNTGYLVAGSMTIRCALGKSGLTHQKREGDGASPVGIFALHRLWWRADKAMRPNTGLPVRRITRHDGWCDDRNSGRYNQPVRLPFRPSHETMFREDHLYDYVIEIGWNMGPVHKGHGSAIFLHLAREGFEPTAGCVAVPKTKIRQLLASIGPRTRIRIG